MNILRTRKFDWLVNDTGWLRRVKVFINSMIFPINYSLGFKCKLYYDIGLSWMNRSCSTVMKKKKRKKRRKRIERKMEGKREGRMRFVRGVLVDSSQLPSKSVPQIP